MSGKSQRHRHHQQQHKQHKRHGRPMPPSSQSLVFTVSPIIIILLVVVPASAHLHGFSSRTHNHDGSQNATSLHVHARLGTRHFFRHIRPQVALSHQFLQAHNAVRRQLNLPLLTWDRDLARYARRWATRRLFDCKMIHSNGPYGENIFWGGLDHWTAAEAVESWVKEAQFYNPNTNECTLGDKCGHYTQVVWRDTLRVGCARMRCLNGGLLIVCEYDPRGNVENQNPFGKVFDHFINPDSPSLDIPIS